MNCGIARALHARRTLTAHVFSRSIVIIASGNMVNMHNTLNLQLHKKHARLQSKQEVVGPRAVRAQELVVAPTYSSPTLAPRVGLVLTDQQQHHVAQRQQHAQHVSLHMLRRGPRCELRWRIYLISHAMLEL